MSEEDVIIVKKKRRNIAKKKEGTDLIRCGCGIVHLRKDRTYHIRCHTHQNYVKITERFIKGDIYIRNV